MTEVEVKKSKHSKYLRGPDGDEKTSHGGFRKGGFRKKREVKK
jgi:hypothetical protein